MNTEHQPESPRLAWALRYAEKGWRIIPLHSPRGQAGCSCTDQATCPKEKPGKHPRVSGWQAKATTDNATIEGWFRQWPDANIGLVLDGLAVLDVDPRDNGPKSLAELEAANFPLPLRSRQLSGSGGWHYLFLPWAGVKTKDKFRPGLDLRTDAGHYIVVAPSLHASGDRYEWTDEPSPLNRTREAMGLVTPPKWLVDAVQSKVPPASKKTSAAKKANLPWDNPEWRGLPARQLVEDALHKVLTDGEAWNDTGLILACDLRDERYPFDEAFPVFKTEWWEKVHAVDTGNGYEWKVALASLKSAYSRPPRQPRKSNGTGRGPSQATLLLKLIDDFEFLKSGPANDAYVRAIVGDHHEVWGLSARSTKVRELLTHRFFAKHGMAPSREALNTVIDTILAQCSMGRKADVHVRFARSRDAIYLDLCDDRWRAVEVDKDGWRVVENPPVLFRRPNGALPLPVPTPGGSVTPLRSLLNCGDDSQWFLMVAWVIGAFLPEGAFSHLVLEGEQGSAKSTTARLLQSLLDPSDAGLSAPPKDETDATVAALHSGILAFDNLSGCRADISDVFCRFSTGQGYKTRTLYENLDLTLVSVKLPVLLNGIDSTVMRPDLLDRSITLKLPRISPEGRRTEHTIWKEFDAVHPGCLGALLDAVSAGLRNLPTTTLADAPRMSDFATWVTACEPKLPWKAGEFIEAYRGKIREASMDLAENDSLTAVIVEWAHTKKPESDLLHGYETTAKTFLNELNAFIDGRPKDARHWPMSPEALAHRLPRMAPLLRSYGIEVKRLPRNGIARSRWWISRELRPGEQAPLPKVVPLLAQFEKDAVQPVF